MKKLARLTALLLTGVMLLLLASCGAAPNPGVPGGSSGLTEDEAKAKQEIFNAINEVRKNKGMEPLQEVPELTEVEQNWINTFGKAQKIELTGESIWPFYNEFETKRKSVPGWRWMRSSFYTIDNDSIKLIRPYEGDSDEFRKWIREDSLTNTSMYSVAKGIGIGVTTINDQLYWTYSLYRVRT